MGYVVSIVNEKGGVGKTTCTYNIATALAMQGYRTLMVDLDYQCSLTASCGYVPENEDDDIVFRLFGGQSVLDLFNKPNIAIDDAPYFTIDAIQEYCESHPSFPNITNELLLVPGNIEMAQMEGRMMTNHKIRTTFLSNIKTLSDYFHFILIDCPPALNIPMTSALIASDGVVIPVKPEPLDYYGLRALESTIKTVSENLNPGLTVIGTILNMFRATVKTHEEYLVKLSTDSSKPLLGTVKESAIVTKGIPLGLPVVINGVSSQPAKAFMSIADQVIARINNGGEEDA